MPSCTVKQFVEMCNRDETGNLGWKPLSQINGQSCFTWDDLCAKITIDGLGNTVDDTWIRQPVVVRNQQLFKISEEILQDVRKCRTRRNLNKFFQDHQLNGESTETKKIKPIKVFSKSIASSLDMYGLSNYDHPSHVKNVHSSAIIGIGRWFTDGHIEEGGDVRISNSVGKKVFYDC